MINNDELEQLTNEQLVQTIIQEFDPDLRFTDFMFDLSDEFNVPLIKNGNEFLKYRRYAQQRISFMTKCSSHFIKSCLKSKFQC